MNFLELRYVYYAALTLAVVIAIIQWKHLSVSTRLIGAFMLYTLLHELSILYFKTASINFPLYAIYAALSTTIYGVFCAEHAVTKALKNFIRYLIIPFSLLGGVWGVIFNNGFPSLHIAFSHIIIIGMSFALMYDLMNKRFHDRLWKDPVFLIAASLFLYHSFGAIYLGAIRVLMAEKADYAVLLKFHAVTSCVFYILIAYLLFRYRKPQEG